jgi:hypothetical protein
MTFPRGAQQYCSIEGIVMKLPRAVRRCLYILLAVVVLYAGSYCCLSACGDYFWEQSGRVRYKFGFAVTDLSMWHPKLTHWQRFTSIQGEEITRGNTLGYFYCPMIMLDRWLVHPTGQVINPQ